MNSCRWFGMLVCAMLASTSAAKTSVASESADYGVPPANAETPSAQSDDSVQLGCCGDSSQPRWTASAEALIWERRGGVSQTLVERVAGVPTVDRVPGSTAFGNLFTTPGIAALTGNDFQQGFCGGPRLGLIRHDDSGYDLELAYYQLDGWRSAVTITPNNADECLVMRAPGQWISPAATPGGWQGWIQTNQSGMQAFAWEYASQLHNAEINVRWDQADSLTLLAGVRWVNLSESLLSTLSPATIAGEAPFWVTSTSNNLLGLQLGAEGKLWRRGRFAIEGLVKAGMYDNIAEQTTAVSVIAKQVRSALAATNHAAFVGETGLRCTYQVTSHITLRAGYELTWLEGVALAPGQIQETYTTTRLFANAVQALGVNSDSGAFYHGATVGLEFAF